MAWQPKALRIRHVPRLTVRGGIAAVLRSFGLLAGIAGMVWAIANAPHTTPSTPRYEPPRITIPTYRPPQIDWSYQMRMPKIELPPMPRMAMPKLDLPRFEMPSRTTIPLVLETHTYTPPVAPAPVVPVERHAPTDVPN